MGTVKTGGIFMWPLLIIPFAVVGLFICKLLQLLRARIGYDRPLRAGASNAAGAAALSKSRNLPAFSEP